jgi:tRNA (mo5U34)-methyltransferase
MSGRGAASLGPSEQPGPWAGLATALAGTALAGHAGKLCALAQKHWQNPHGDLPRWQQALDALPTSEALFEPGRAAPRLGAAVADTQALAQQLMSFHPWRKGPLELGGVSIDSEWRSDWKWQRIAPHLDLAGQVVLDVGCGNGYFGWRMLAAGARCVVGIDPTVLFVVQWLAQCHFARSADGQLPANYVLPLKDTQLPAGISGFDTVLSMGVLYHRRQPAEHLQALRQWLRPGGTLVLETLVLEGEGKAVLVPDGRYARMRNVWHIPQVARLLDELAEAGFSQPRVASLARTTTDEQRSTAWMQFESLDKCLAPADPARTVEGHPAPLRVMVLAGRGE